MGNDEQKPTILVVDDTPENIDIMNGILKPAYKVKVALNGEKALKIVDSDKKPDLVLLDIMMPGMDGYEVCRRIKANESTAAIPVIFVSGEESEESRQTGFSLGAVDYVVKPIDPASVMEKIKMNLPS